MNIVYNPLRIDNLQYKIEEEIIYIKHQYKVYKIDFTDVEDGRLNTPLDFIPFAEKIEDELTVTIRQAVDSRGNAIEQDNEFDVEEYEELDIDWITQEEIDEINNVPRELSQEEKILQKVIDLLPASVIAAGIDEQYQSALAELNLD